MSLFKLVLDLFMGILFLATSILYLFGIFDFESFVFIGLLTIFTLMPKLKS